uniref:Nucleotide binding oligomerization domain containing 2 n=1 Tax=Leptobrachium leishanense TaxID=445787 RepID=A0A8C5Q8Z4_9ANUR
MCALQSVRAQREYFVSTLAGGTAEKYESLLDYLLSWDILNWEEYEHVTVLGQPLAKLVRELLDIIACKGEKGCGLFLKALHKIDEEPHDEGLQKQTPKEFSESKYLQSERPRVIRIIHQHIDDILHFLLEKDYVSKFEVDMIKLPVFSPAQKARRLLDLLRVKGNDSARCLLAFIQQLEQGIPQVPYACLRYQKKLKTTISAQSQFLSTYDGTENICLENIYTNSILEISKSTKMSDNIQDSQNPLDLTDIFNADGLINKNADTVLILGDAGSGKSTLLQKIHHLWAEGNAFHKFAFIFPFSCRRLGCVVKPVSLMSLLFEYCCWPDQLQEEIFQFILANPNQVLLTFDGFDEFKFAFTDDKKHCSPTDLNSIDSIVFNLLQGNLMKDSIKVLTSRPDAVTAIMRTYIQKEIHLKGFSEEGIELFMKKHHTNPDTSRTIIDCVKANSSLHGLCHIPVFCWIVSKCHEELIRSSCSHLQTITDTYVLALQHFLRHASPTENITENVLEKKKPSINHLGKLALNGLCHGLYVFSHDQVVEAQLNKEDLSLGFLVPSKNFSTHGTLSSQHYEFLHITFQCLFAALYIAMSDDVEVCSLKYLFRWSRIPKQNSSSGILSFMCAQPFLQKANKKIFKRIKVQNLQITANFVSGLFSERLYNLLVKSWQSQKLSRKQDTIKKCLSKAIHKHFKSIPPAVQGEIKSMHAMPEFIWLIKCINEMQNVQLSRKAVKNLNVDHLKLTYCRIGPAECTALANVLKHLKNPTGLQLDDNSIGDIGLEQLIPCLHICKALYLRNNSITDKGICKLLDQALHWENFQKIALGNNFITGVGAQRLAEGLRENQSIQYLGLWGNKVGDVGSQAIAEALQHNRSLIWLSLVSNDIGSLGAQALADMLERNTTLQELCLEENQLNDDDVTLLAEALKKNSSLKVLKLSNNLIGKNGVSALTNTLQHNATVKSIWLKGTNLTPEEMQIYTVSDHRLLLQ